MITRSGKEYEIVNIHGSKPTRARKRSEKTKLVVNSKKRRKKNAKKPHMNAHAVRELDRVDAVNEDELAPLPSDDEFFENENRPTRRNNRKMSDHLTKVGKLKLDGQLSDNWRRFKRNFDIFMCAGELNEKSDAIKINTFLNAIGEDAVEVFDSFNLSDEQRASYNERFMFNQRNQKDGESFDAFHIEIKRLARTCEYNENENEMLRDRIVIGVNDQRLQAKLLETKTLTYDTAVEKCRANEATKEQSSSMNKTATVDIIQESGTMRNRNSTKQNNMPQYNNNNNSDSRNGGYRRNTNMDTEKNREQNSSRNLNNNKNQRILNCNYCGYSHEFGRCPAYGKTCDKCHKKNHFRSCCKSRDIATLSASYENFEDYDFDDNGEFLIACLDKISTEEADDVIAYPWIEKIGINESKVPSKIDTGAEIDVLPLNVLKRIAPRIEIRETGISLKPFAGESIKPLGTCILNCCFNGMSKKVKFAVVGLNITPILGLRTCVRFGIVAPSRIQSRIFENSNVQSKS